MIGITEIEEKIEIDPETTEIRETRAKDTSEGHQTTTEEETTAKGPKAIEGTTEIDSLLSRYKFINTSSTSIIIFFYYERLLHSQTPQLRTHQKDSNRQPTKQ